MFKRFLILVLSPLVFLQAQEGIMGQLTNLNSSTESIKIQLLKIGSVENLRTNQENLLATKEVTDNNSFHFQNDILDLKDQFYKIRLLGNDIVIAERIFISSRKDTLIFTKDQGNALLSSYITSNRADKEWQKLTAFENSFQKDSIPNHIFLVKQKTFLKDSLEILLVKLAGISKLQEEKLLKQDILKNTSYYRNLLSEFESSDLHPTEYQKFKESLGFINKEKELSIYKTVTLSTSGLLVLMIFSLFLYQYHRRKTGHTISTVLLSNQENIVKDLIVDGKSNKEIADELFISLSTVKTHITNLYTKTGVKNRSELKKKFKKPN